MLTRTDGDGESAEHWAYGTVQRKFSDHEMVIQIHDRAHCTKNTDSHRKVESCTFLADVGRRKVDCDRLVGYPNPEFIMADLMRSRLSRTAVSGMPTRTKSLAMPVRYMSTSTSIGWASMPKTAALRVLNKGTLVEKCASRRVFLNYFLGSRVEGVTATASRIATDIAE